MSSPSSDTSTAVDVIVAVRPFLLASLLASLLVRRGMSARALEADGGETAGPCRVAVTTGPIGFGATTVLRLPYDRDGAAMLIRGPHMTLVAIDGPEQVVEVVRRALSG